MRHAAKKGERKSSGNPFKDFARKGKYYGKQIGGSAAVKKVASAVKKGMSVSSQKNLALKLVKGLF